MSRRPHNHLPSRRKTEASRQKRGSLSLLTMSGAGVRNSDVSDTRLERLKGGAMEPPVLCEVIWMCATSHQERAVKRVK